MSGRGLCDGLINRPEYSYRLWCVAVCDLEINERGHDPVGPQRHGGKKILVFDDALLRLASNLIFPNFIFLSFG